MVNELNGVGSGYAPGVSQYSPPLGKAGGAESLPLPVAQSSSDKPEVQINTAKSSFPALSDSKDAAAQIAQSARGVNNALDKADALLADLKSQVDIVKDYPPYPAGNEARVKYLNSIDGLRKQLQSMAIPPVAEGVQPVFYPQEDKFPPLDAKTPSDAAVLAFGDAVAAVKANLDAGRAELQTQVEQLSAGTDIHLPRPPAEPQAQGMSFRVAGQLAGITLSLAGGTDVLAQL